MARGRSGAVALTFDQAAILTVLAVTIAAFLWGRVRHDVVALGALLACAGLGLTAPADVFSGFGHPAVITVASVLVLSAGLLAAGAVDMVARVLFSEGPLQRLALPVLLLLAASLSAFMNNVGALALLMPVGLQLAERAGLPPGKVLMPLAYSSILGGMATLIGTPPNLIVAGFRQEVAGASFAMFDFTPVGAAVVVAGLIFIGVAARWLVPERSRAGIAGFETSAYFTEARVPAESKAVGMSLAEVERLLGEAEGVVTALIRNERHIPAPSRYREIHAGDVLQIRADHDALAEVLSVLKLELEEASPSSPRESTAAAESGSAVARKPSGSVETASENESRETAAATESKKSAVRDPSLVEVVVLPGSVLAGRSASDIHLRTRFDVNLLAVSRQGEQRMTRMRDLRLRQGDVLLLQGSDEGISEFLTRYNCAPLAPRALGLAGKGRVLPAAAIMVCSTLVAAFGIATPPVAFAGGVLAFVLLRIVPERSLYEGIDWPVIVLLGALIPVAEAMSSSGAADLIARILLDGIAQGRPMLALAVILIVSMTLSDFMNNAATAAVMCPVAIGTADQLALSADPFLMAVAVGASCAFLTPIGHQNNTLILGPGGFRFGDYWRLGMPLEVIVVAVAVPLIAIVWPLAPG